MSETKPKKKKSQKSKAPAPADVSPNTDTASEVAKIRDPKDSKESYSRRWIQTARKRGNPTKLNQEIHEKIVNLLRRGNYLETAAASVGIDRFTLRGWIQAGINEPDGIFGQFARDCEQAQAEWEVNAVEEIAKAGALDWRATHTRLQSRFPERWNPNRLNRLEVSGPGGNPIEVNSTRDRLAKKIAALTATQVQDAEFEEVPALPEASDSKDE